MKAIEFDWRPVYGQLVRASLAERPGEPASWPSPRYRAAFDWLGHRVLTPDKRDPTTIDDVDRAAAVMLRELEGAAAPSDAEAAWRRAEAQAGLRRARQVAREARVVDLGL